MSIIIRSRNAYELIARLLNDLLAPRTSHLAPRTDYQMLEVIIVDNGSSDRRVFELYEQFKRSALRLAVVTIDQPFNFSQLVNRGISQSSGSYVCLLKNDIEVKEPGWLKEMISCLEYSDVGIVGAKLLYPDRSLQHAGVIVGLGDLVGHWFIGREENFPDPMGRLWVRQSMSTVTGACIVLSRDCISAVGAFDETTFPIAYNDVDYCLRAIKAGYRIIWTPFSTLIHHESASRGSDERAENSERFERDKRNLKRIHATEIYNDFAFNPW